MNAAPASTGPILLTEGGSVLAARPGDRGASGGEPADERIVLDGLYERARAAAPDPDAALALADTVAEAAPLPGAGRTAFLWSALATLAAADLTVARSLEPHLDALAILDQARRAGVVDSAALPAGPWGVFAAEGPGVRLESHPITDGWVLRGVKPWCSLVPHLGAALVTAWEGDRRRLWAVDTRHPGVSVSDPAGWVARGLSAVPSTSMTLDDVPAVPVGEPGWYIDRPGFAWGGMGVAAIWYGATVALGGRLLPAPGGRTPDQIALMHLGEAEIDLQGARAVLLDAARAVDSAEGLVPELQRRLAYVVRGTASRVADRVLARVGRATGPGPMAFDEEHARRVADLAVYIRQDHAERDAAMLGSLLAGVD